MEPVQFHNPPPSSPSQQEQPQGNGLAVAGLVLGIIGAVLFFVPFLGWILALLGIIFGALGNGKANKIGGKGKGMAMAGLILGIIGLIAGVAFFMWALNEAKKSRSYRYNSSYSMVMPVAPAVAVATPKSF